MLGESQAGLLLLSKLRVDLMQDVVWISKPRLLSLFPCTSQPLRLHEKQPFVITESKVLAEMNQKPKRLMTARIVSIASANSPQ